MREIEFDSHLPHLEEERRQPLRWPHELRLRFARLLHVAALGKLHQNVLETRRVARCLLRHLLRLTTVGASAGRRHLLDFCGRGRLVGGARIVLHLALIALPLAALAAAILRAIRVGAPLVVGGPFLRSHCASEGLEDAQKVRAASMRCNLAE
jgi:hypothetical protein